jgi:hypothetical protein
MKITIYVLINLYQNHSEIGKNGAEKLYCLNKAKTVQKGQFILRYLVQKRPYRDSLTRLERPADGFIG